MSDHYSNPSFGGPSHFARQWPPRQSRPSMNPYDPPFNQDHFLSRPRQPQNGTMHSLDYNNLGSSRANSRIPGLGTHNSTEPLPPPPPFPFTGQFPHQHFPPLPFPPAQMPPLAYPPMPMPAFLAQHNEVQTDDTRVNAWPSNILGSQTTNTPISRQDVDREEGEVTDREGGSSLSKSAERTGGSYASRPYNGQNDGVTDVEMSGNTNNTTLGSKDPRQFTGDSPGAATRAVPGLEEGEALSSMSSNSTRDSGSPYNPPMTVSAEPYDPRYPSDSEKRDEPPPFVEQRPQKDIAPSVTKEVKAQSDTAKLPAQLRVQAQGALLGLAPHNIRYNELVEEGINAMILRRLYEEVGIRVATSQPDTTTKAPGMASTSDTSSISVQSVNQVTAGRPEASTAGRTEVKEGKSPQVPLSKGEAPKQSEPAKSDAAPAPSPAQLDTSKPLERKELIARMLAAKAAKTSSAPLPSHADVPNDLPIDTNSDVVDMDEPASATPLDEAAAREKDTRVKEKNKAQTELARQRIEQLKKQGLMRNQPKPLPDSAPQATPYPCDSTSQAPGPIPKMTQHPLPDRPPEPEWGSTTRLPGLFMMAAEQCPSSEPFARPVHSDSADATRQPRTTPRTTPRKRPRASDFDEPTIMPKRQFTHGADASRPGDRVVIDLSDDEFYGDDENDIEMDTTLDQTPQAGSSMISLDPKVPPVRNFPSLAESLPQKPSSSVNSRNSASATPQGWGNVDEANLRKKHMAIQEMHRKIAELEQRKKPKPTASPTQSAHVFNSSASSLDGHTTRTDIRPSTVSAVADGTYPSNNNTAVVVGATPASTQIPEGVTNGLSAQMLASMDALQLERLRSMYLRKEEIEAGLPSLDAEIMKSEAKLEEFKEQKLKLLSEIAKGKKGRRQLVDELGHLDLEINGLSLEDIEAAQRRQAEEPPQRSDNESGHIPMSSGEADIVVSDASAARSPGRDEPYPVQENIPPVQSPQLPVITQPGLSGRPEDTDAVAEGGKEASSSSMSESEGSTMDESSDSDSSESASIDQEISERSSAPGPASAEDSENLKVTDQEDTSYVSSDYHSQSLAERPRHARIESHVGEPNDPVNQEPELEDKATRESSVASEGYEPPEPKQDTAAYSAHSSPFSPSPTGPVGLDESRRPSDQVHADKTLTGNAQGLDSHSIEFPKVGPLDNEPRRDAPDRKFTPYTSPLKYFKAYRYHPDYADQVSDGYRSLTYSHNIDPMKYLCPFEAAGGVCNDRSCEFQHFRDMNLSDDKVLIQMGSLREGRTPEEKDQYIAGLKQIINDMRRDSVRDFISVAKEIAAYRRRFLEDPSRILPL